MVQNLNFSTLLPNLKISEDIQIGLTASSKHFKNEIHVHMHVVNMLYVKV